MKLEKEKRWENLTISNDFIFSKLVRSKEICKELLEILLNIKVGEIKYPQEQKGINLTYDAKSIRLDVYTEDEKNVYNIEMQVTNSKDLAKRTRYYQGLIDLNIIDKGEDYKELKESYIIFICTFDPFNENLAKYEFRNYCKDKKELELKDGAYKIFFNSKAFEETTNKQLKEFLQYVNGEKVNNKFIEKIDKRIEEIKSNSEWRREYMTLAMKEREIAEINFMKGKAEGRAEEMIKQIETLKELNIPNNVIIEKVSRDYEVEEKEIEKYL